MTASERHRILDWLAACGLACLERGWYPALLLCSSGADDKPGMTAIAIPTLTPELVEQILAEALALHRAAFRETK